MADNNNSSSSSSATATATETREKARKPGGGEAKGRRGTGTVRAQVEAPREVVTGESTADGDDSTAGVTTERVKVWLDLCDTKTGKPIDFDSVPKAKKHMVEKHESACRFRVVTIHGPWKLEVETVTKTSLR